MHARFSVLALASLTCAAAAFVACGLQTSGVALGGSGTADAGGTAGHSGSATGGTGGGLADAGPDAPAEPDASPDAGPDAAPKDAGPTYYASCKALLAAEPGAATGVYTLRDGAQGKYQAYCAMEGDGGGWTLALKINGDLTTFEYGAVLWTDNLAYNPDHPALDTTEAKLASYWSVPFTELRVGMIDPTDFGTRWLVVPLAGSSLLDLVNAADGGATSLGKSAWEGLLQSASIQTNCNWEGINADGHVRIGLVGDESGNCQSPDSFIGFGADTHFQDPQLTCGNTAHDTADNGDRSTPAFGYVMVR